MITNDEYVDNIIALMFLLSPISSVQFLSWKCMNVSFIKYINGIITKNEYQLKISLFVAIIISEK